jgi:hypothetical protein
MGRPLDESSCAPRLQYDILVWQVWPRVCFYLDDDMI